MPRKPRSKPPQPEPPPAAPSLTPRQVAKAAEEEARWSYYRTIPKRHWLEMSGRQSKVINEQAARYELPLGGPVINLPALARALHDFLAKHKHRFNQEEPAGEPGSLEEWRHERMQLARLDRLEREGQLVPREAARQAFAVAASVLRQAGEQLQRQCGAVAHEILTDALADAALAIDALFAPPPSDDSAPPQTQPSEPSAAVE